MDENNVIPQNQGNAGAQMPNYDAPNANEGAVYGNANNGFSQEPHATAATYGHPNGAAQPPLPPHKSKKWLYWVLPLIIVVVLGAAGGAYYYYNSAQSEETAYSTLLGNENVQDYEDYLKRFPNGDHAEEVRQRLQQLKTMYADWTSIQSSEYASDFERFKSQYPASQLVKQCDLKIDSLDWVTALKLNTPEAMAEYMDKHPEGRYYSEASVAQNSLASTQVDEMERSGIQETLSGFYTAFGQKDEATLCTYITTTMTQFLNKKNATKADVVGIVNSTYSEDIENCSFVLNNDYQINKSVSSDGKATYKVSFSVDQHIQRSGEGKTFGSYTATATLNSDFKISALSMKEVSRQNQE